MRNRDLEAAERHNNEVLEIEPDNHVAKLNHATILKIKGQPDKAMEYLNAYRQTEAGRKNVDCLLGLAELYHLKKDFEKAGQLIEEAEQLAPENLAVFRARLACLAAQKRFEDIVNLGSTLPADKPNTIAFLQVIASILAQSGNDMYLNEAVSFCQRTVELAPQKTNVYVSLGQVAYIAKDTETAVKAYRKALELNPVHQQALNDLAWILVTSLDKPEEAIELADKGVSKYPNDPHLRDTRAVALIELNRLDEARTELEKCLELSRDIAPTQISALRHLGQILVKQGQPDEARQRFSEALKINQKYQVLTDHDRAELQKLIESPS